MVNPSERPVRPRLLVLLGAGSTIHAGAPSTQDLTEQVFAVRDEPICSVVKLLREQRSVPTFDNLNFETVLACLQELGEFALRKRCPKAFPKPWGIGGELSAFAELRPDLANCTYNKFLCGRDQSVGRLKNFVIQKTRNASPARLRTFFDRLREKFDLTVVTLNYDDLVDRAQDWYDGFDRLEPGKRFGTFDFAGFSEKARAEPAVLLHLHGSVRFDFGPYRAPQDQSGDQSSGIVRYGSARCGLGGTLQAPAGIANPTTIVAGDGKDQWMTRAGAPFAYYYQALTNAACDCPRLLVAGYGGGDPHINSWLTEEHPRIHDASRRLVEINPNPVLPGARDTASCLTLGGNDGCFPPEDPGRVDEIIEFLKRP